MYPGYIFQQHLMSTCGSIIRLLFIELFRSNKNNLCPHIYPLHVISHSFHMGPELFHQDATPFS